MEQLDETIVGLYIAEDGFIINKDISSKDFKELLTSRRIIKPPYFANAKNEGSVLEMSFNFYLDFYGILNGFDWSRISVCFICWDGSIFVDEENGQFKFISSKILHSSQSGSVSRLNISSERLNDLTLIKVESDEIDFTEF
ncbi:UNVERIFIED_CONTAM: hypothetical protein POZ17_19740 [Ralstonia mannitolilytica]